jgi:hypothetical protein
VPRSTAFVQTIWSCTWPRPCAVAVARFWSRAPLSDATPSSRGGTLQDHGWRPQPAVSVDRVCAGHLALHMASTVRGCGASPSDSGPNPSSAPFPLAPGPLATRHPPPEEAPLKTTGGGRGLLSRSTAFVQAIWPCTWPRPCATAAPQPPRLRTRNRAPNRWGLSNACQKEREGPRGGKVPGPGLTLIEARTHVLPGACDPRPPNGQELLFLHCSHI